MKTLILNILLLLSSPYIIGKIQYNNTIIVCQNLTDRTDEEIENVLSTFDFNNDWQQDPTTLELYNVGMKTIINLFN